MSGLDRDFWRGKRVLLTGHTGFKGAWLAIWLQSLGAEVTGIALAPHTRPSLYDAANVGSSCESLLCDIRNADALEAHVSAVQPEIVFHLAAQALVRASYREPRRNFETNVMGTANLLDAVRNCRSTRVAVLITTDKVYCNKEWHWPYREIDPLGGHDPYSASKAACEIVIASYRDAFLKEQGVAVASARAGNVIGGGDWSEDRIIPDAVKAWEAGARLTVRRPLAIRPWQHVLEPLFGYLRLARRLWDEPQLAGAYNFGPHTHEAIAVGDLVAMARTAYGKGEADYCKTHDGPHEAAHLMLEIAKARAVLNVTPRLPLKQAIEWTMAWYRAYGDGASARELCLADIAKYEGLE